MVTLQQAEAARGIVIQIEKIDEIIAVLQEAAENGWRIVSVVARRSTDQSDVEIIKALGDIPDTFSETLFRQTITMMEQYRTSILDQLKSI